MVVVGGFGEVGTLPPATPTPKPTGGTRNKRMRGRERARARKVSIVRLLCGEEHTGSERERGGEGEGEEGGRVGWGGREGGSGNIRFHYLLDSCCICSPPGFKAPRAAQGRWHVLTGTP